MPKGPGSGFLYHKHNEQRFKARLHLAWWGRQFEIQIQEYLEDCKYADVIY